MKDRENRNHTDLHALLMALVTRTWQPDHDTIQWDIEGFEWDQTTQGAQGVGE